MHCQYLRGEAPQEELDRVAALDSQSRGDGLGSFTMAVTIIAVLAVVGLFGYFLYRKRQTGIDKTAMPTTPTTVEAEATEEDDEGGIQKRELEIM